MGVFRQLGDPLAAAACLCQHHGAAYAETMPWLGPIAKDVLYEDKADDNTIVQAQITITETCCVVVNAASIVNVDVPATALEIERPLGTIRTQQEDHVNFSTLRLLHHASWEVLAPGTYDYFLVNRAGAITRIYAAWIKAIASDCEG